MCQKSLVYSVLFYAGDISSTLDVAVNASPV